MTTLTSWFKALDRNDRGFLIGSVLLPLLFWWLYYGRRKYSTKGMR